MNSVIGAGWREHSTPFGSGADIAEPTRLSPPRVAAMGRLASRALQVLWVLPIPIYVFHQFPIIKILGRSMQVNFGQLCLRKTCQFAGQPTLNPDTSELREDFGCFNRLAVQSAALFERGDIVLVSCGSSY